MPKAKEKASASRKLNVCIIHLDLGIGTIHSWYMNACVKIIRWSWASYCKLCCWVESSWPRCRNFHISSRSFSMLWGNHFDWNPWRLHPRALELDATSNTWRFYSAMCHVAYDGISIHCCLESWGAWCHYNRRRLVSCSSSQGKNCINVTCFIILIDGKYSGIVLLSLPRQGIVMSQNLVMSQLLCVQRSNIFKRCYRYFIDYYEEITTGCSDVIVVNSSKLSELFWSCNICRVHSFYVYQSVPYAWQSLYTSSDDWVHL